MQQMTMIQAINSAMDVMMERDPTVVVMGEDVGFFGGVFRATAGLQDKYGKNRVFDTPITECGIIGVAVGMGAYGLRPVPEIQFADYIYPALDQLVSEAARLRYRSAGEFTAPMTVRSPFGGGIFGGQTHSQSPEGIFTHCSGIKTVIPSTPYDAKGLLIAAIEDNDPTLFFEPKRIYNGPFSGYYDKPVQPWKKFDASVVPEGYYKIPLGKARHVTEGDRLTVLAYGTMVHVVEAVCREKGVEADSSASFELIKDAVFPATIDFKQRSRAGKLASQKRVLFGTLRQDMEKFIDEREEQSDLGGVTERGRGTVGGGSEGGPGGARRGAIVRRVRPEGGGHEVIRAGASGGGARQKKKKKQENFYHRIFL